MFGRIGYHSLASHLYVFPYPFPGILPAAQSPSRLRQEPGKQDEAESGYFFSSACPWCWGSGGGCGPNHHGRPGWPGCSGLWEEKASRQLLVVDAPVFLLGSLYPTLTYVNLTDSCRNPTQKELVFCCGLAGYIILHSAKLMKLFGDVEPTGK